MERTVKEGGRFGEWTGLVESLAAEAGVGSGDPAHDMSHLARVWGNVSLIAAGGGEGVDMWVMAAATALHDAVNVPKNDPRRSSASRMSADLARAILSSRGWEAGTIEAVAHVVEAHSFSAGIEPQTWEAMVFQDADRLDALGAVGLARVFVCSGSMGRALYEEVDPMGRGRELDEDAFSMDHVATKLVGLWKGFRTEPGKAEARRRTVLVEAFVEEFMREVA